MKFEDRFDSLIQFHVEKFFPECDWRLIKAQVAQESRFQPKAESPVGARGLLQLMPTTDLEVDGDQDGFEIEGNLDNGIRYLRAQYIRFPEAPDGEKIKFALASYNGGRGYVNKALALAYQDEHGVPMPQGGKGAKGGKWRTWDFTKTFLKSPECTVNGRTPDWKQMTEYVDRILGRYGSYL